MIKQQTLKQTTRLAVALSLLLAAGCSISDMQINEAIKLCEPNDGLNSIDVNGTGPGTDTILCKNGATFERS